MENNCCSKCVAFGCKRGWRMEVCPCHQESEAWTLEFDSIPTYIPNGESYQIRLKSFIRTLLAKEREEYEKSLDVLFNKHQVDLEEAERRGVVRGLSQNGRLTHEPPLTLKEEIAQAQRELLGKIKLEKVKCERLATDTFRCGYNQAIDDLDALKIKIEESL